jgi:hypothetical protein
MGLNAMASSQKEDLLTLLRSKNAFHVGMLFAHFVGT